MQHTTNRRFPRLLAALLASAAAIAFFAPASASADSAPAIRGASTAVLAIRASVGLGVSPSATLRRAAPEPAATGFISDDLLQTAMDVVNNGVRISHGRVKGAFYVHAKPQGFGGVVSIRYRR